MIFTAIKLKTRISEKGSFYSMLSVAYG